ncbi:MAG TPA: response regulator transcription factor [Noviherbaspirillum sp.]|jgi:DNA-binding NarL/FixJ family response regulator|uniref:response regulator transcription factor n=1 Tax=Noviherbaspirillum sp. TaxID=1926288 RepID=UPI002DDDA24A|nr:response regulator transcription factor [Noviherbaspirillum sp.]HEV2610988.1 response regulator transcription factor [Noviherbaspirillum sp.]
MTLAHNGIRVLLVDDHQTMLWGLQKLVEGESPKMEVVGTARSCDEAVTKAGQLVPDVILLDLDMGGTSSLDILPALLSNSVSRVLVLTGEREREKHDKAVLHGARGVLMKDASADQLLKAIEKTHQGELWLDHGSLSRVFSEMLGAKTPKKPDPEAERKASLTARERNIIRAIVADSSATNKVIAQGLFISEHTLRNHLTSIYHKLDVINRLELYLYAVNHKLADPQEDPVPKGTVRLHAFIRPCKTT